MQSAESSEDEMLAKLRAGDEQALAQLFGAHRERLARLLRFRLDRRIAGRVDCEDILQEAYLAAAQRLNHFPQDNSLTPFIWLRMMVLQTLVDVHRRHLGAQMRDAGREISLATTSPTGSTSAMFAAQLMGSQTSPSGAAMRAETEARLVAALDAMTEIDREVLALRHFEELTNSEVAEILGIQPKAASIRYIRAVGRLKEIASNIPGLFQ